MAFETREYTVLRPVLLSHVTHEVGATITLPVRAAQFLIADGTLGAADTAPASKPAAQPAAAAAKTTTKTSRKGA